MNSLGLIFVAANAIALLSFPRQLLALPLLLGAVLLPLGGGMELAGLDLPPLRMLIAVGFVRVLVRGERLTGGVNGLDRLLLMWAGWAIVSSLFHDAPLDALVNRLGLVYNACGVYFLLRVMCGSFDDTVRLCRILVVPLSVVAIGMLVEKATGHNFFADFGVVSELSSVRGGAIRAQGPFAHAILAGTVGAASLPITIGLWKQYRKTAIVGIAACCAMVLTSTSSGPILSAVAGIAALLMWHWRGKMRLVRWLAGAGYVGLELVMNAPAYYIISYIDLTGSSTSFHRAALIEAALTHLSEWWLVGTDYTRHWLPYGVNWSANHADITNYYLRMGVDGGLPLMFLFIGILVKAFSLVGVGLQRASAVPSQSEFMVWAFGASLFSHTASFISVSYYDQSFVFFDLIIVAICTTATLLAPNERPGPAPRLSHYYPMRPRT